MNLQPRIEVDSRMFCFMLLPIFYFVKIAPIGREKYERCFRQPAWDCDDRRDRTEVYPATTIECGFHMIVTIAEYFCSDRSDHILKAFTVF